MNILQYILSYAVQNFNKGNAIIPHTAHFGKTNIWFYFLAV